MRVSLKQFLNGSNKRHKLRLAVSPFQLVSIAKCPAGASYRVVPDGGDEAEELHPGLCRLYG